MHKLSRSEAGRIGWEKSKEKHEQRKKDRISDYESKPVKCAECNTILPYSKRHNKFCGHSCATSFNNAEIRPCLQCGANTKRKYCSLQCKADHTWQDVKQLIEENGFEDLGPFSKMPKRYLIGVRGHQCEMCKNTEWMGQTIPLVLDHIDGNSDNRMIDNLRLLCPNCDAQTPTYKGKNRGNGRHYRRKRYADGKSY